MKKNEYVTPEMEIVELETSNSLLDMFSGDVNWGGDAGDGEDDDPA